MDSKYYAAHVVMLFEYKQAPQVDWTVFENVYLVKACSHEDAMAEAERIGRDQEGDSKGTLEWDGRPARFVFRGVRKVVSCLLDPGSQIQAGGEVTYSTIRFSSASELDAFLACEPVAVTLLD